MKVSICISLVALAASGVSAAFHAPTGLHRVQHHARGATSHKRGSDIKKTRCAAVNQLAALNAAIIGTKIESTSTSTSSAAPTSTPAPVKVTVKVEAPAPPPAPKPAPKPAPAPAPKPKADNGNGGGGGSGAVHSGGDVTFYSPGLNACGTVDGPNSMIVALAHETWDNWPNFNGNSNEHPLCHKPITVTWQGKSVTVTVTDRCGGCDISASVDLSPNAFSRIASQDLGRVHGASWQLA